MRLTLPKVEPLDVEEWHKVFTLWPVRLDNETVIWLEHVMRKLVVDDEGSWAGGYKAHWEYKECK